MRPAPQGVLDLKGGPSPTVRWDDSWDLRAKEITLDTKNKIPPAAVPASTSWACR
jgi:hypothetical protein